MQMFGFSSEINCLAADRMNKRMDETTDKDKHVLIQLRGIRRRIQSLHICRMGGLIGRNTLLSPPLPLQ